MLDVRDTCRFLTDRYVRSVMCCTDWNAVERSGRFCQVRYRGGVEFRRVSPIVDVPLSSARLALNALNLSPQACGLLQD